MNNNHVDNENVELTAEETNELLEVKRAKLRELIALDKDPYCEVRFDYTHSSAQIKSDFEAVEGKAVAIAGRLVSRRIMGKASFGNILDANGNIQVYFKSDLLGERYDDFKDKTDIGDILGINGIVFRTKRGEISVQVESFVLLSKSLQILPEKWHGLKDTDTRYRMRYVDLIANPEVKATFVKRSRIISAIREYLDSNSFVEVETPILNNIVGGANARPFLTHHNTLDLDMFLRISPELYLKRLIVGGFERVYELGRMFRNEGMSVKHNPEFTMMELYQAYADYNDMMDITENIYRYVASKLGLGGKINYQGTEIDLESSWKRVSMIDIVKECTGLDFATISDDKAAVAAVKKLGNVPLNGVNSWGTALYAVFDAHVESKLIQPTFVTDYPIEVSPLAKRKKSDPRLTERFEFFIYAREMGNAYSELNDPIDQRGRFEQQMQLKAQGDQEAQSMDTDFCTALEYGMPPTGGLGLGIDRMVMLFTDSASIRDILLFPTMKPLKQ